MSTSQWRYILLQCLVVFTCSANSLRLSRDGKGSGQFKLCERLNPIAPSHSSCIQSPRRVHEGLDIITKRAILKGHNDYRRQLRHYREPPASNMQLLRWDSELEEVAQRWASHCMYEHDNDQNRAIPGRYSVGQNIAWTSLYDWNFTLKLWHNEYKDFHYGIGSPDGQNVGHYTQMVWATTNKLGCGYAFCNGTRHFYVCNYGPAGNIIRHNDPRSKYKPYRIGPPTHRCHRNNPARLCDCGGKVCYNGGSLDLQTCQCKCINRPWIDKNRDCALDCRHARDTMVCKTNPRGIWGEEYCNLHFNVAREYCPVMCHWCPGRRRTFPPLPASTKYKDPDSGGGGKPNYSSSPSSRRRLYPRKYKQKPRKATGENELLLGDQPQAGQATSTNTTTLISLPTSTTSTTTTSTTTTTATSTTMSTATNVPYDITEAATLPPPCLKSEPPKCGQPHKDGYYPPKYCTNPMVRLKCPAMCATCSVSECSDYYDRLYLPGQSWLLRYGRVECTPTGAKFSDGCIKDFGTPKSLFVSVGGRGYFQDGNYRYTCTCTRQGNRKKFTCRAKWVEPQKRWS